MSGLGWQHQNEWQWTKQHVLCLFVWIVFDEWPYKRNLKSLHVVLLVMKPVNVWHLAHKGCTRFTAPFRVWHPFKSPLSTFQTCSHYFQQPFLQQMPRKTWQDKYKVDDSPSPPSKRSTVCHSLMFIHPAEWKFHRGRKVKHSQTCWELLAVSIYVWKMAGDSVKQPE